jgi:hypothetical protein
MKQVTAMPRKETVMKWTLPALIFCLAGFALAATPDKGRSKPIWEWTDEERIQLRLADGVRQDQEAERQGISKAGRRYVIDGATHPELFMPDELFSGLIGSLRLKDPEERRRSLERRSKGLQQAGFEVPAFWDELEPIVAPYFAALDGIEAARRDSAGGSSAGRSEREEALKAKEIEACRARFEALQRARVHFGPALNRFLYSEVAPHLSTGQKESFAEEAPWTRFVTAGCRD